MGRPNPSKVICHCFGIKVNSPYLYKVLNNITNEAIIFNRTECWYTVLKISYVIGVWHFRRRTLVSIFVLCSFIGTLCFDTCKRFKIQFLFFLRFFLYYFSFSFFIAVIKTSNTADSRRAYQCIKFLVQLANKCPQAKDYLLQNSSRWQWAVQWLKRKMNEHYWAPHTSSSNEYSSSRTFQRTSSAADTLAEATALLTELEAKDGEASTTDDVDDSVGKFEVGEQEDWEKEMTN